MNRRGSTFRRCTRCNARAKERACPKCGSTSLTWAYMVDVAAEGEPRKQRMRGGFGTRTEARAALHDVIAALRRDDYVEPSKVTVGEFVEEWLSGMRSQVRPTTLAAYSTNMRQHVIPELGKVPLQSLTPERLDSLYADLLESGRRDGKGLSPKSVINIHIVLHRALKDAVRKGRLQRNVADLADPPKAKAAKRDEMQTWTADQLRAFLEHVGADALFPMWHLDANTGLRRGELLGLRWPDIDFESAQLSVRRAVVLVNYVPVVSEAKTGRGRRTVALDAHTIAVLREHRKRQLEERLALGPHYQDDELVFCRPDGTGIHPQHVTDRFEKLVARAGLPRIRLHDLRHTHATLALRAGVPVKVVSERLGHASTSFTMDTYQHVVPGMQEDAAEAVAALIAGPRPVREL